MALFKIIAFFGQLFGKGFNPAAYAFPPPKHYLRTGKSGTARQKVLLSSLHYVAGQAFAEVPPAAADTEWVLATPAMVEGRVSRLTPLDQASLRGALSESKACLIKPLWAGGLSNKKIAAKLTQKYGRGFSTRTVSDYAAAFARALEKEQPVQTGAISKVRHDYQSVMKE